MRDNSDEARDRAQARIAMRRRQKKDPLRERQRLIEQWRAWAKDTPQYAPHCGAWWRPFVTQPGFRWLLATRVRARIELRNKAQRDRLAAEMRAYDAKCRERKAAKLRAAAPQSDLFTGAAP